MQSGQSAEGTDMLVASKLAQPVVIADAAADSCSPSASSQGRRMVEQFDLTAGDGRPSNHSGQLMSKPRLMGNGHGARAARRAEQFEGVAQSLADAAAALRRAVAKELRTEPKSACGHVGRGEAEAEAGASRVGKASRASPGASPGGPAGHEGCAHGDGSSLISGSVDSTATTAETSDRVVAQLELENAALRADLGEAMRRLAELEEERRRFFDEGIYDLVNMVWRSSASMATACPPLSKAPVVGTGAIMTLARLSDMVGELLGPTRPVNHGPEDMGPVLQRLHAVEALAHALAEENERLRSEAAHHHGSAVVGAGAADGVWSPGSPGAEVVD